MKISEAKKEMWQEDKKKIINKSRDWNFWSCEMDNRQGDS